MSGATKHFVERKIAGRKVLVFTKSNEADSNELRRIFSELSLPEDVFEFVDIEKRQDARQLENYLRFLALTDRRKSPYIFVDQLYFGSLFEFNNVKNEDFLRIIDK